HSPAASPSRILAFISAARRFHCSSGISPRSVAISRMASNAASSSRHLSQRTTWRAVRQRANMPRSPPASSASVARAGCFIFLPLPSFDIPAKLGARVRDVRPHRRFRAIEPPGHFLGRQSFDIAEHQRGPLARTQQPQPVLEIVSLFGPEERLFGTFRTALLEVVFHLAVVHPIIAAQKIDRGVRSNTRQPMCRFLVVLNLVLVLERLNKGFLGQVLCVRDIPDNPIDLYKDPS